jgi:hypothetical protein
MGAGFRKRTLKLVCLTVILLLTLLVSWGAWVFLSADVVMLASVREARIGEPPDKVDAYVPDNHRDQYYFVRFNGLRVLRGAYPGDSIGIRLHSPALTFGIGDDQAQGSRYLLFLRRVSAPDGSKVLVLTRSRKME